MTTEQDYQIMAALESTYGVKATPTRTLEFVDETLDWEPTFVQGAGLKLGKTMDKSGRRALGKSAVGGDITIEALTKGNGWLYQAALGAGSSALIGGAGSAYQQLFTLGASDYLPSYTIQKGIPPLGGASLVPKTFLGMQCTGFELSAGNAGIPTIKFGWMGKDVDTASSLATAAYPTGVKELSFVNASLAVGGTLVLPTSTALATVSGSPLGTVNVRDVDFTWDNGLDTDGYNFGGGGKRSRPAAMGKRTGTGTMTAEFTDNMFEAAYLAQTDLSLVLTYALSSATDLISGSSYPALQLTIPELRLEGELAKSAGGGVVTQSIGFTALDGESAASPIYVAIVTAETAI